MASALRVVLSAVQHHMLARARRPVASALRVVLNAVQDHMLARAWRRETSVLAHPVPHWSGVMPKFRTFASLEAHML